MAKYDDLVKAYSDEIEAIKIAQLRANEAREALDAHNWNGYETGLDEQYERLCQTWDKEQLNASIMRERLSEEIEHEYWDVPFAKPRQQGITRFWEEAGI